MGNNKKPVVNGLKEDANHLIEKIEDKIKNSINNLSNELDNHKVSYKKDALSNQLSHLQRKVDSIFHPNLVTMELEEIQSIILRRRPAPYYGTLVALKVNNANTGRQLLRSVLGGVSHSLTWHNDMDASLNIVMTFEGLKALGVPQDSLDSFPDNFKAGMESAAKKLGDVGINDPKNWHAPFGKKGEIHICAAIIADNEDKWQTKIQQLRQDISPYVNEIHPEEGDIEILIDHQFGSDDSAKNVFGFRDGISNPEVAGSGISNNPEDEKPIASGEFVMGYKSEDGTVRPMPQPEVLGKNGSFMVLRKYQCNVADFNRYCIDHTENQQEADKLAAKMFGRWRSGAPVTLSPDYDDETLGADDSRNNKFDYTGDVTGKGCPFGAHARRMNPRNSKDFVLSDIRLHRIIRRSVSFGDIVAPDITVDDGKERGLYFIGINAQAMNTLEFLQSQWINDGNFMNLGEERDPLLGVHNGDNEAESDTFTEPSDPIRKRHKGILQFNTLQGGEYLFIPSISALKWISEL